METESVSFIIDESPVHEAGAFSLAETFALKGICVFFEGELGESGYAGEFVRGKQADGFLHEGSDSFEATVDSSLQESILKLKVT